MKGHVFHTHTSFSSDDARYLRCERLSVCLDSGVHIAFTVEKSCHRQADGTVQVLGSRVSDISLQGKCDGVSCRRSPCLAGNDEKAVFQTSTFADGDSGAETCCFGGYHFRFVCDEFGSGWYAQGVPVPCDGTCRPREIRLPPSVASFVRQREPKDAAA